MNPVAWLAIVVILALLALDWAVKKRRVRARPALGDEEFLNSYRCRGEPASDAQILEARRRVAQELGLPECKIQPGDRLTELRDRYCLVVSGHLALSDLHDDLDEAEKEVDVETVGELITALLRGGGGPESGAPQSS